MKFKAKSWIDMFGGRAAKFVGSLINSQFTTTAALTLYTGYYCVASTPYPEP